MKSYFRYIRNKIGDGIGAIAIEEDGHGGFNVGISICAPSDTFDKSVARYIAVNRLKENPIKFSFYELVDNDWIVELVDALPHRNISDLFCSTMFDMVDDIIMDYAREHYKSLV